ncbi:MAG TPA: clostripain-related cysteine peptidase [Vicinamibacterales bacterium]|nr:clostripain-related cysteine peptidase [Vicinamibacterales bacterium]
MPETCPWLVMLYLAGDNNLSEEMVLALQDLLAVGPPKGDAIVAQFDPSGVGLETQRYDFTDWPHKGSTLKDYCDTTFTPEETNAASVETLTEFVTWATEKHPAERRLLILSGHGSGTTQDFLLRDDAARDALSIPELQEVLTAVRKTGWKIDVLGMDACYMSMGEVAYEIRKDVGILVGSEGLSPAFGWPYREILTRAINHRHNGGPPMKPEELAAAIVEAHVDHYSEYDRAAGRSADLAAVDLGQIDGVAEAFRKLVVTLKDSPQHDKLLLAHWYAQTYKAHQFVDLMDLCGQIRERFAPGEAATACSGVLDALRGCTIRSDCSGSAYQHSHGLSIYFPWAFVSPDYDGLEFPKDTEWAAFLREHLRATQRDPRPGYELSARSGPDPAGAERKSRLWGLLIAAGVVQESDGGPVASEADADPETVHPLKSLCCLRGVCADRADFVTKLKKIVDDIARTDIQNVDLPREIGRRMLRGRAPGALKSRYTGDGSKYTGDGSKYTGDGSRFSGDREMSFKNLPPAIGRAREGRVPAAKTAVAHAV